MVRKTLKTRKTIKGSGKTILPPGARPAPSIPASVPVPPPIIVHETTVSRRPRVGIDALVDARRRTVVPTPVPRVPSPLPRVPTPAPRVPTPVTRVISGTPIGESSPTVIVPSRTPELDLDEGVDFGFGLDEEARAEIAGAIYDTTGRFIGFLTTTGAELLATGATALGRGVATVARGAVAGTTALARGAVGALTEFGELLRRITVFYSSLPSFNELVLTSGLPERPTDRIFDMNNIMFYNINTNYGGDTGLDIIARLFHNFPVKLIDGNIKLIGEPSANGRAELILYRKTEENRGIIHDHRMYNVLKISQSKKSDNNYYEFLVGLCLNRLKRIVPNFVFTFSYIEFNPLTIRNINKVNKKGEDSGFLKIRGAITKKIDYDTSRSKTEDFISSCRFTENSAILIEGLPNSVSFENWLENSFQLNEFINIVFQVYYTLNRFKNTFTHYDLHSSNVLIQKVPDDKYVTIEYKGSITIKTKYIPVLIDYGRCYIDCDKFGLPEIYSRVFADKMCNSRECITGRDRGFYGHEISCETKNNGLIERKPILPGSTRGEPLVHNRSPTGDGYLKPELNNVSQDNRFIWFSLARLTQLGRFPIELSSFTYLNNWPWAYFAVEENKTKGYTDINNRSNRLNNVTDTLNWIIDLFHLYNSPAGVAPFVPRGREYGKITIYATDRPWTFTPSP